MWCYFQCKLFSNCFSYHFWTSRLCCSPVLYFFGNLHCRLLLLGWSILLDKPPKIISVYLKKYNLLLKLLNAVIFSIALTHAIILIACVNVLTHAILTENYYSAATVVAETVVLLLTIANAKWPRVELLLLGKFRSHCPNIDLRLWHWEWKILGIKVPSIAVPDQTTLIMFRGCSSPPPPCPAHLIPSDTCSLKNYQPHVKWNVAIIFLCNCYWYVTVTDITHT